MEKRQGTLFSNDDAIFSILQQFWAEKIEKERADGLLPLVPTVDAIKKDFEGRIAEIKEQKERVYSLLRDIPEGLIILDGESKIQFMNPALELIIGPVRGKGNAWYESQAMFHQFLDSLKGVLEKKQAGAVGTREMKIGGFDDFPRKTLQVKTSSITDENGKIVGRMAVIRDVTEEARDLQLMTSIKEAAAEILKKNQTINEVAATEQATIGPSLTVWTWGGRTHEFDTAKIDKLRKDNEEGKLDIFVDLDGTVYFVGKKVRQLKKATLLYLFLLHFLKNKGVGGTYRELFVVVWKEGKVPRDFEMTPKLKRRVIRMTNRLNGFLEDFKVRTVVYEYEQYRFPDDFRFCFIEKEL